MIAQDNPPVHGKKQQTKLGQGHGCGDGNTKKTQDHVPSAGLSYRGFMCFLDCRIVQTVQRHCCLCNVDPSRWARFRLECKLVLSFRDRFGPGSNVSGDNLVGAASRNSKSDNAFRWKIQLPSNRGPKQSSVAELLCSTCGRDSRVKSKWHSADGVRAQTCSLEVWRVCQVGRTYKLWRERVSSGKRRNNLLRRKKICTNRFADH